MTLCFALVFVYALVPLLTSLGPPLRVAGWLPAAFLACAVLAPLAAVLVLALVPEGAQMPFVQACVRMWREHWLWVRWMRRCDRRRRLKASSGGGGSAAVSLPRS